MPSLSKLASSFGTFWSQITKRKRSKLKLNDLPDLCLLAIFHNLPLRDLFLVGLVCSRWHSLQRSAFLTRRHISLVFLPNQLPKLTYYTENLKFVSATSTLDEMLEHNGTLSHGPKLTSYPPKCATRGPNKILYLPDWLLNVKSLEIAMYDVPADEIETVSQLLEKWSGNVQCLKIWIRSNPNFAIREEVLLEENIYHLLEVINSLTNLRKFTFNSDHYVQKDITEAQLDFILRLEEFYFSAGYFQMEIYDHILVRLARNSNLKRFGIGFDAPLRGVDLQNYLKLGPQFLAKMTDFQCRFVLNTTDLKLFSQNFCSITKLDLISQADLYPIGIAELGRILYPLKQLVSLEIAFDFDTGFRTNMPLQEFFSVPKIVFQLESIKLLTLELKSIRAHTDMHSAIFGLAFPSLEVVRLKLNTSLMCIDCMSGLASEYPFFQGRYRKSCIRQLLWPFKKCLELKRIVLMDYKFVQDFKLSDL